MTAGATMKNNYAYFQNRECEYFPCHKTAGEDFNCLFCYCPLYALGDRCGGNCVYTDEGVKDCSHCLRPHCRENYGSICKKLGEVLELVKKNHSTGEKP